jgi:hypothetical protein
LAYVRDLWHGVVYRDLEPRNPQPGARIQALVHVEPKAYLGAGA